MEIKGEYKTAYDAAVEHDTTGSANANCPGTSLIQYCGDDQAIAAVLIEYNYSMTDLARAFLKLQRARDRLVERVEQMIDARYMDT